MSKLVVFLLFVLLAVVQIAIPASMILRREETLDQGTVYRFQTKPVDPYDAFRGRYVRLGFEVDTVSKPESETFAPGQKVYAVLGRNSLGFATIESLELERPEGDYVEVRVRYTTADKVFIELPFDRYYMEEESAPEAERAYLSHTRERAPNSYVAVRIKDGLAVLEELYIDGLPIRDYMERESERAEEQAGSPHSEHPPPE